MKKISVIVPAYNAEKTIRRCLESLTISTYKEFEVIVVDDGSNDNTVGIVKKYGNNDNRIKLISKSNAGPSAARNSGLDCATGDIITFVDSDDYVEANYFHDLSHAFDDLTVDVVFFEFARVDDTGGLISSHKLPNDFLCNDYFLNLIHLSEADMFGYTWLKAFRRELLFKSRFDNEMQLFEDEVFTCTVLKNPVKMVFLHKHLYNYVCVDSTSLARKTHRNYHIFCDKVYIAWKDLLGEYDNKGDFLKRKANHMQKMCKYYGLERDVSKITFFRELSDCEFMKDWVSEDLLVDAIKKKKWIYVYKEIVAYKMKILISKLMKKRKIHETT